MRKSVTSFFGIAALAVLAAAGCGSKGNGEDAQSDLGSDTDASHDSVPDADVPGDTAADRDATPDVAGDEGSDPDVIMDPAADGDPDTVEDPAEDPTQDPAAEDTVEEAGDALDVPADGPDAPVPCSKDDECELGAQWCVDGYCVPCDNTGMLCDIACIRGWDLYVRHGCTPCECAPPNACAKDDECEGDSMKCYAGAFCWDWCVPPDPSCCMGNICSQDGCSEPPPVGCFTRGCPIGKECVAEGCTPSTCFCSGEYWGCTEDCGGGTCI